MSANDGDYINHLDTDDANTCIQFLRNKLLVIVEWLQTYKGDGSTERIDNWYWLVVSNLERELLFAEREEYTIKVFRIVFFSKCFEP